jgi:hypothetical protein
MENSGPAVIDDGGSGPMAPEDQPPVFDPEGEARRKNKQVMDDSKKTDAQLFEELKQLANEAADRRTKALKDLRDSAGQQTKNFDWSQFDELMQNWRDDTIPTGARIREPNDPTNTRIAPDPAQVELPAIVTDPM